MSNFQGKGSNQRPHDKDKFNDNFDKIFGSKKEALQPNPEGPLYIFGESSIEVEWVDDPDKPPFERIKGEL